MSSTLLSLSSIYVTSTYVATFTKGTPIYVTKGSIIANTAWCVPAPAQTMPCETVAEVAKAVTLEAATECYWVALG
jgi:hypothetical protein